MHSQQGDSLDGKVVDGKAWETTPYNVVSQISKGFADNAVIARVNSDLWDLDRPLERDVTVEILKFEDTEGMYIVLCSLCVCVCVCVQFVCVCVHALGRHAALPQGARVSWEDMLQCYINNGLKFHEWNTFT